MSRMTSNRGARLVPAPGSSVDARPFAGHCIDNRKVDLVVVGVEVEEQLVDLVHDLGDTSVGPVHLVDHQDHRQVERQRFAQHEAGLGQRPFGRVDQQQNAVDHGEGPLDLTTEVRVSRRVQDVDLDVAAAHGGVLGQDGDAALSLEVHRVHHPVHFLGVVGERAGLTQHGVYQRGLAMIDVGDDGDVAEVGTAGHEAGQATDQLALPVLSVPVTGDQDPQPSPPGLPQQGRSVDDVIDDLTAKRANDVQWADGRAFGMVYDGGPSVHEVAERAATLYLHENALNTKAFPSLASIQSETVAWTAALLNGPATASGFLTSGGTESILCGVKAARERGRAERGITEPEMVLAESAHAAFHKAGHLFGIKVNKAPVDAGWRADVDAMAAMVNDKTVLVVGSAPQYPQGVIDPIANIAALAQSVDANCHVDACMGGFVLPFAERLGYDLPPWDFRVEGVSSISADIHKLGYAPKGVSVILHRTKELRRYQTFVFDDWLGGFYASPNLQGTRSGLPMAAAWAVMQHLGIDGYTELTRTTLANADAMRAGVAAIDGIRVLGDGVFHLVAIASDPDADHPLDVFALGDALLARGWFHDRQGPPDSLHSTVSNSNTGVMDAYLADLADAAEEVRGKQAADRATNYATLE